MWDTTNSCEAWLVNIKPTGYQISVRRCGDISYPLVPSCHIWRSHITNEWVKQVWTSRVTYAWVMSHMEESCHVWMSHVTYGGVMSRMNEPCHVWRSRVTCEWVMSHMKESYHACHVWIRDITYEYVISCMIEFSLSPSLSLSPVRSLTL